MSSSTSLTRRRWEATRLDIARTAARLFAEQGTSAVTVERIAGEAGVSLRTFYRYFRSKEEAVAPLLGVGAGLWQEALAGSGANDPREAIPDLIEQVLGRGGSGGGSIARMRGLLQAAAEDPALEAVWQQVNHDSERQLCLIIGSLVEDADPLSVRLLAAAATHSIRIGLEHWARSDDGAESPAALASRAFVQLSQGIELRG
ncbi:helix-turn-helix domain-containing protein [Nesterenkonia sp. HG001]|uniref:TetR/AcrR family transcriptional regulator n=1 Tax=Nesterenkonia sp. HG001 TaxID=2983207 RepID=UPI002AC42031|nr:helix-turn-helix domain-containing protein [Nesterenkonia sp. HG001]MDZ5079188.1 TetR/AcrR family transcriptional regulator [Nesterenkonia sp. HG001]